MSVSYDFSSARLLPNAVAPKRNLCGTPARPHAIALASAQRPDLVSPLATIPACHSPGAQDGQQFGQVSRSSRVQTQVLKDNISGWTLKSVSATRWESRVESVKAIRFQCANIREALLQVAETDNDVLTRSEALGLAKNELGEYEFIVAIVIWYEVLFAVNLVSKNLQAKDMLIDVAIEKVQGLISFFKGTGKLVS
ncbi:uncharacterized protein LOC100844061 [Brachypodium distachyon]|uniref:uncharacterized protein LOC100844061 n=1 Tax=Brachypodium distachyon TaxID=15368 RepID=UPI000D0CE00E|nr:uncharacterized protein LOC100844061 [Brachypodium distachyon]|eukprot:XP_024314520.1 uncharacterized protein LOC100844061 [Brachypodium distachyon]